MGGGVLCLQRCFGGRYVSKNIHMNVMTQSLPAEYCIVRIDSGFNVMDYVALLFCMYLREQS